MDGAYGFVAGLIVGGMLNGAITACTPEPCTPADLHGGEMSKLAAACEARVLRECGSPPAEDCPALIECDRQGEQRCAE